MTIAVIILSILFYGAVIAGAIDYYRQAGERDRAERSQADATRAELAAEPPLPQDGIPPPAARPPASGYVEVWDAFGGLGVRMALLAASAEQLAQQCRQQALRGQPPTRLLGHEDYYTALPTELADAARRPGPAADWKALDRALRRISAIYDSKDAALHADAHEQLSIAARGLAEEIGQDGADAEVDHCVFCWRGPGEVRLLGNQLAAICEDCVHACHTRFDDV
jgi:hypothetical protein